MQTFEKMEGFSFVTLVTGLNRHNTGKEDDDDTTTETLGSHCCKNAINRYGRAHKVFFAYARLS
jgi:hypothetical protein